MLRALEFNALYLRFGTWEDRAVVSSRAVVCWHSMVTLVASLDDGGWHDKRRSPTRKDQPTKRHYERSVTANAAEEAVCACESRA